MILIMNSIKYSSHLTAELGCSAIQHGLGINTHTELRHQQSPALQNRHPLCPGELAELPTSLRNTPGKSTPVRETQHRVPVKQPFPSLKSCDCDGVLIY